MIIASNGAGAQAMASILLSLYNGSDYVCELGPALARLDAGNRALALQAIGEYCERGETQALRDAVGQVFEHRPEFFEKRGRPSVIVEVRGQDVASTYTNARDVRVVVLNHNVEGLASADLCALDTPDGDVVELAAREIDSRLDPGYVSNVERTLSMNFGRAPQGKYRY